MSNTIVIDNGNGYCKAIANDKKIKFANITGNYRLSDEIKSNFGQNVLSLVKQTWNDDDIRGLYKIVLTGGGSAISVDTFNHIPQLVVSKNPQWDTVLENLEELMNNE